MNEKMGNVMCVIGGMQIFAFGVLFADERSLKELLKAELTNHFWFSFFWQYKSSGFLLFLVKMCRFRELRQHRYYFIFIWPRTQNSPQEFPRFLLLPVDFQGPILALGFCGTTIWCLDPPPPPPSLPVQRGKSESLQLAFHLTPKGSVNGLGVEG